jgi:hypothetical protein
LSELSVRDTRHIVVLQCSDRASGLLTASMLGRHGPRSHPHMGRSRVRQRLDRSIGATMFVLAALLLRHALGSS